MSSSPASSSEIAWNAFESSFLKRRWNLIAAGWVESIPSVSDLRDNIHTISDYIVAEEIFGGVPEKSKFTSITSPRSGIPKVVMSEAICWLHKSIHVFSACETHIEKGLPTWSLSSAYQAGYFAARSILAFYGVAIGEVAKRSVAVDLCRGMQNEKDSKILAGGGPFVEQVPFRSAGILFDHNRIWELFQKLLRVSDCRIWPPEWKSYLSQLDLSHITKQRHGLHYTLSFWVEDDLLKFAFPDDFRFLDPRGQGRNLFDHQSNNFTLAISALLLRMALMLFTNVSALTKRMEEQRKLLETLICQERHPLFMNVLLHSDAH